MAPVLFVFLLLAAQGVDIKHGENHATVAATGSIEALKSGAHHLMRKMNNRIEGDTQDQSLVEGKSMGLPSMVWTTTADKGVGSNNYNLRTAGSCTGSCDEQAGQAGKWENNNTYNFVNFNTGCLDRCAADSNCKSVVKTAATASTIQHCKFKTSATPQDDSTGTKTLYAKSTATDAAPQIPGSSWSKTSNKVVATGNAINIKKGVDPTPATGTTAGTWKSESAYYFTLPQECMNYCKAHPECKAFVTYPAAGNNAQYCAFKKASTLATGTSNNKDTYVLQ